MILRGGQGSRNGEIYIRLHTTSLPKTVRKDTTDMYLHTSTATPALSRVVCIEALSARLKYTVNII